jgi:hypothetical protein
MARVLALENFIYTQRRKAMSENRRYPLLNKVMFIGRLVRDCEVKFLESSTQITHFSIALDGAAHRGMDKEVDGQKRTFTNFMCDRLSLLGSAKQQDGDLPNMGQEAAILIMKKGLIQLSCFEQFNRLETAFYR